MKLNSTEIVTLKSQGGINLKTRRAFIRSNKHPSNQGKALLCHNVSVLGGKKTFALYVCHETKLLFKCQPRAGTGYKVLKMNNPWCSKPQAIIFFMALDVTQTQTDKADTIPM